MEARVETLREARQVALSAKRLCRLAAQRLEHDRFSCACDICAACRFFTAAAEHLGRLERPDLERDDW